MERTSQLKDCKEIAIRVSKARAQNSGLFILQGMLARISGTFHLINGISF